MIGSTFPGHTTDVMRADIAARLRDVEERQAIDSMRREVRVAGVSDCRVRRSARITVLQARPFWRVRRVTHRPGI